MKITKKLIQHLYDDGLSIRKIAELLDCSFETARKWMIGNGIERRKVGAPLFNTNRQKHNFAWDLILEYKDEPEIVEWIIKNRDRLEQIEDVLSVYTIKSNEIREHSGGDSTDGWFLTNYKP